MDRERVLKILASFCAATEDIPLFKMVIGCLSREERDAMKDLLQLLKSPKLVRLLARNRGIASREGELPSLVQQANRVQYNDGSIGTIIRLVKKVQPHEAQARIAYDVFYQRFFDFLASEHGIICLYESNHSVELFVPENQQFDLDKIWMEAVDSLFGLDNLRQTFIALVNSIKLTERGFSALDVPIVNPVQAQVLAAFDRTNLASLERGDRRRGREIAEIDRNIEKETDPQTIKRLQKSREKIENQLEMRRERYGALYKEWDTLLAEMPIWAKGVQQLEGEFSPRAGTQIAKAGTKIGKAVQQMKDLSALAEFFQIPPLLGTIDESINVRIAGDSNTRICYSCGAAIPRNAPSFQANTFIFASPSQRLQSGGSQTQPNVCGACAALSFVSPIKLGEGRLVVRLCRRNQVHQYMLDDQMRMFVLGELNIVAGRYALLVAGEKIGNDSVIDKLGSVQYAIYKVATLFPIQVFDTYEAETVIGESIISLQSRHLAWMARLINIFPLQQNQWNDKSQFAAFGRAIRHLQKEELIHTVYELLKSGLVWVTPLDARRAVQLETLRLDHVRWLMDDNQVTLAEFYRDVAAMTGLLYAFCSYTRDEVRKAGGNDRIEVRKLIERTDDPNGFIYTTGISTKRENARLFRNSDMHFSYDETKRLLGELQLDAEEREETNEAGQRSLSLYFDDVVAAYTTMSEKYNKAKDWREFRYALQLSLHARFPEYIKRQEDE